MAEVWYSTTIKQGIKKEENVDSHAIFKTDTQMNPYAPENATFYDKEQVAYVLTRPSGTQIVATSFGNLGLKVGGYYAFHHDQSRRGMGNLEVAGITTFATGTTEGEVPNAKLPHFVFK
jgi:hypothetical protein